ncbi:MAG: 2-C-methyl-D-erythritol 2,4-cyclodiphosphate synthase [Candidatus Marinimicrobia bacterium]|nr:2-C-methyl-D-erythritol 2,4-cyclodiphosphate synthase [Candidatus Neomarinimicrobiota bacterium]
MRTGMGYDAHQLAKNRKLIIAGITIPNEKGSVGHSDGDALSHAIIDAVLGAACLGDLGDYFPSNDDKWKDANSLDLLSEAIKRITSSGYTINNIDSVVIIQKPKLKTYILKIRENLAKIIGIPTDSISVKATTVDHLGAIGACDGWATQAIVTISK